MGNMVRPHLLSGRHQQDYEMGHPAGVLSGEGAPEIGEPMGHEADQHHDEQ